jgi:hypothetical protein
MGASHDGILNAVQCSATSNYIMVQDVGNIQNNTQNLFYFSTCSIKAFKSLLLTSDLKFVFISGLSDL